MALSRHRALTAPPLVSIVIPAYNAAPYIAETLESALAQTHARREIIVIDDGSTDDTEIRVAPYLSRIRYRRQANAGTAAARNTGLRMATGDYIAFLDADDIWQTEKLEIQLRMAARHPESCMIVCDGVDFGEGIVASERLLRGPLASRLDQEPSGTLTGRFYSDLIQRNAITCPAQTLIPRAVADRVGPVLEKIPPCEDWEYNLRIAHEGPITFHRDPLVRYRRIQTSVSGPSNRRSFAYTLSGIFVLRRHMLLCSTDERPVVRRSLREHVREQGRDAYYVARRGDASFARAYLLKLLRAAPEEPSTLFWLLATWAPERAMSMVARLLRRFS